MENNKCLILCIVIILCIIGVASSGSHKSVDIDEKIGIDNFDSGVTNYSTINNTGLLWETYLYSVFFDLENVSSWYDGGEVIVYFYNDNGIVLSDEVTYKSNNTTTQIDNNSYNENFEVVYARGFLHSDKFVNITHVTILLINDGVVVFNETRPFDMNNYENDMNILSFRVILKFLKSFMFCLILFSIILTSLIFLFLFNVLIVDFWFFILDVINSFEIKRPL